MLVVHIRCAALAVPRPRPRRVGIEDLNHNHQGYTTSSPFILPGYHPSLCYSSAIRSHCSPSSRVPLVISVPAVSLPGLGSRPAPPAPEGWDKGCQPQPIHQPLHPFATHITSTYSSCCLLPSSCSLLLVANAGLLLCTIVPTLSVSSLAPPAPEG